MSWGERFTASFPPNFNYTASGLGAGLSFFIGIGDGWGAVPSAARIFGLLDGNDWGVGLSFFIGIGDGWGAVPSAVRILRLLDSTDGETSFPRILFVCEIGPEQKTTGMARTHSAQIAFFIYMAFSLRGFGGPGGSGFVPSKNEHA
jgi:hypothetical protein